MKSTIPSLPKVRHTLDRSGRTYYVVNAGMHFGLPVTRPALVLILRQFRAALLVDRIDRMAEIPGVYPLPLAFTGDERRWYRGLAYLDDSVIPVVEPTGLLTPQEFQRLDRVHREADAARNRSGGAPMSSIDMATETATDNSFVLLQIGHRRVALPAALVAELAPPVRLHTFPHTTPLLAGVIVRRGRIVPVVDTEPVLGGKSPLSHRFYLIAHRQRRQRERTGRDSRERRMRDWPAVKCSRPRWIGRRTSPERSRSAMIRSTC